VNNYVYKKRILFLLLSFLTTTFYPSQLTVLATTQTPHARTITQYIQDVRRLNNQVFSLTEQVVNPPAEDLASTNARISFIYNQLQVLDRNIANYLYTLPKLSTERRDTLILLDALHYLENSLYQLTEFINEENSDTKMLLLEDFYFLRASTTNTLGRLEDIISRE
jgi:hypothetical protein